MARLLYHDLTLLIDVQLQLLAGELVEDIDADETERECEYCGSDRSRVDRLEQKFDVCLTASD